jgi:hypothetical protein
MSDLYWLLAVTAGAGFLGGVALATMVLLEHPVRYLVCLRISGGLYDSLRRAARENGWAISTEATDRLLRSFDGGGP